MAKATLLLVDDTNTNRLMFKRLVERQLPECRLFMAVSAEEAQEMLQRIEPDCAILDVDMPGMSGLELCHSLKAGEHPVTFPILLITAMDTSPALRAQGLEAGADDFIQRPCENIDLIAKIRVLLRIKKAEDQLRAVNKRLAGLAMRRSRQLHENDIRYRFLLEACSDAVFIVGLSEETLEEKILEVNDHACQWTGYTRDELLQLSFRELFPDDIGDETIGLETILQHKQMYFETRLQQRSGRQAPVALYSRLVESDTGSTIIGVLRRLDIRQENLAPSGESDDRFRTLATQMGQIIYDCDVRSGAMKWGGALTQVTGYMADEMKTFSWKIWRRLIHSDDQPRVRRTILEAMRNIGKYQIQYRLRNKLGKYHHVEDMGVVLPGENGRAYRIVGALKDVTARVSEEEERRRLERELQHSQRLESLGVLAGGIAHDFNNILAAIIGLTDMAIRDLPEDSDLTEDLKEALQAGHRAKELVKQILMFSRQTDAERAPLFLHVIVREALKLLRASLPATIDIIDSVDVHSSAIMANAAQMHQVVMNYCTNAAQAMKKGGKLEVRLADVYIGKRMSMTLSRLQPGLYLKLSVIDNGHGMESKVRNRMFDPFYTTKGPGEGTGMGLAVVHGIITSHGGAIDVETKANRGTSIHTYLPVLEENVVLREEQRSQVIPKGTERVLFVDDEEGVRRFVEAVLPRQGYHLTSCKDGPEALEKVHENPAAFDILVTDQIMPRMTGEELARQIRPLRPDLPILLFTGFSENLDIDSLRALGIKDVVMKPVIANDLATRIRKVLDSAPGEDFLDI